MMRMRMMMKLEIVRYSQEDFNGTDVDVEFFKGTPKITTIPSGSNRRRPKNEQA